VINKVRGIYINLCINILGYVRITDFGVAKLFQKENSSETSGTPGYMAPEVLCAKNHSYAVDYFALGVMAYEFMLGVRPYLGKSRREIKEVVLAKQVQIKRSEIPDGWSVEAADFINKVGTLGILFILVTSKKPSI
jgi:serine/threonine protein kinase